MKVHFVERETGFTGYNEVEVYVDWNKVGYLYAGNTDEWTSSARLDWHFGKTHEYLVKDKKLGEAKQIVMAAAYLRERLE